MVTENDLYMLKNFFASQPLGVLATQDFDQPYSSLVALAPTEDLRSFIFATARHTRKYANLKRNKRVSILTDNRENAVTDFSQATAVSIIGTASEISDKNASGALDHYASRHPNLRDFASGNDCALFQVTVNCFLVSR